MALAVSHIQADDTSFLAGNMGQTRNVPLGLSGKVHHTRLGLGVVALVGLLEETVELLTDIAGQ